jgi:hypothetical protein
MPGPSCSATDTDPTSPAFVPEVDDEDDPREQPFTAASAPAATTASETRRFELLVRAVTVSSS